VYLLVVRISLAWGTEPVVVDTSWSTETVSPGFVAFLIFPG